MLHKRKIRKFTVFFRNKEEIDRIYHQVFVEKDYDLKLANIIPYIIDCGAHIGSATLYFKSRYPKARIIAFEPNPDNFILFAKNIVFNKLKNVRTVNAALSDKTGSAVLYSDSSKKEPWTWGDSLISNIWGKDTGSRRIKVKTIRLSSYIDKPVDLLKMDIEGVEERVIKEIEPKLNLVRNIVIEYHLTKYITQTNKLSVILDILKKHGFTITAKQENLTYCFPKDFPVNEFVKKLKYDVSLIYGKKGKL